MRAIKEFLLQFTLVRDLDLAIRGPRRRPTLADIPDLQLPPDERFRQISAAVNEVQGMLDPFPLAVTDMMLSFQRELGAKGDLIEIGAFRGKCAALLGRHLREDERLTLIDIFDYLDPAAIEPFRERVDFILTPSQKLRSKLPRYRARRKTFRFVHIDASHKYEDTYTELKMADELLGAMGIIALDDFANLDFSANMAAIFKYLYTSGTRLMPVLVTNEKAYLCRRRDFNPLAKLILERSGAELGSRGHASILARTSYDNDYKAFSVRPAKDGESGRFYGPDTYQNQILGL